MQYKTFLFPKSDDKSLKLSLSQALELQNSLFAAFGQQSLSALIIDMVPLIARSSDRDVTDTYHLAIAYSGDSMEIGKTFVSDEESKKGYFVKALKYCKATPLADFNEYAFYFGEPGVEDCVDNHTKHPAISSTLGLLSAFVDLTDSLSQITIGD
jgi:hypothetical protein